MELFIALSAAASVYVLDLVGWAYPALGGEYGMGIGPATAARLVLAMVMGPSVFAMGATLPTAARAVTGAADHERRSLALLYGANTMGAVIGVLLATFVLFPLQGFRITLWLACLVNVALAAILVGSSIFIQN